LPTGLVCVSQLEVSYLVPGTSLPIYCTAGRYRRSQPASQAGMGMGSALPALLRYCKAARSRPVQIRMDSGWPAEPGDYWVDWTEMKRTERSDYADMMWWNGIGWGWCHTGRNGLPDTQALKMRLSLG